MENLETLETELTENLKREEELEKELKEIRDKKYILKDKIARIKRITKKRSRPSNEENFNLGQEERNKKNKEETKFYNKKKWKHD